jgi:hypothetical protein
MRISTITYFQIGTNIRLLFVCFLLAIVLSVLLRFIDSDYLFGMDLKTLLTLYLVQMKKNILQFLFLIPA